MTQKMQNKTDSPPPDADGKKGDGKKGGKGKQVVFKKTERKWKVEEKEIDKLVERYVEIQTDQISSFADLPLSAATQKGLKESGFVKPTGEKKRNQHIDRLWCEKLQVLRLCHFAINLYGSLITWT